MKHLAAALLVLTFMAYSGLAFTDPAADMIQETNKERSRGFSIEGIAGGAPVPMARGSR